MNLIGTAYADVDWGLCPRERLEHLLATNAVDPAVERDVWRWTLEEARKGDYERGVARLSGVFSVAPPEGNSWVRWAEWVEQRLTEVAADGSTLYDLPPHLPLWRPFTAQLDPTAEDVVRRALAGVAPPEGGAVRDYVVVEAEGTVGAAVWPTSTPPYPDLTFTRQLGVVVERTDETRVVAVNAVDPWVDGRFPEWRARWPALTAALGGWFSDAALARNDPWWQQVCMLEQESDEQLAGIAREGAELLHLPDDDLRSFAVSAGSCVLPQGKRLRWWFEWMVWRIGEFDWKRPA